MVSGVDRLAFTIPCSATIVPDKLGRALLTAMMSEFAPTDCRVSGTEAELNVEYPFGLSNPRILTEISALEVRIIQIHAQPNGE